MSAPTGLLRLREVRELRGLSSSGVLAAVGRGELRRYGAPWGWGYDRAEVEALAQRRQETRGIGEVVGSECHRPTLP